MPDIDPTYRLLALCARAEGNPTFYKQLTDQLRTYTAWDELPAQAEIHGMAPLLWHHIRKADISIPEETHLLLGGLYLRHRLQNQIHANVLMEIMEILQSAGIQPLVLKGLALAYEYYPDPALRPISDIDLLFKQDEILPALSLLADAGFDADLPSPTLKRLPKELTAVSPPRDRVRVNVELHHYDPNGRSMVDHSLDDEFMGFSAQPHSVKVNNGFIFVPDPLNTLDYLIRHLLRHLFVATASIPLPLKWIADIISLAEHHAETINWSQDPALLNRLEVLYSLTPLPENLVNVIPIRQIEPPDGAGQYPQGWPQEVNPQWKQFGFLYYMRRTLTSPSYIRHTLSAPSNWWLRLYYGIDDASVFWYGQVVYRLQVLKMIPWKLIRK
jgi:hypothetical protein